MTKRQKKQTPDPVDAGVQRTTVKRAQQSGKRAARAQATRLTGVPAEQNAAQVSVSPQVRRGFVLVLMGLVAALLLVALFQNRGRWWTVLGVGPQAVVAPPTAAGPATNPISQTAAALAGGEAWRNRVGLVSGHRGNDSGTVCSDGLTEAQVNFDAATRAASILRAEGFDVDVLDEFDARLKGYRARALLSIHADSCEFISDSTTGYKVARFLYSAIPEDEDKLVACLSSRYKKSTGLPFHRTTVTHNMLEYHAFREIDPKTPGAIIELGFMYKDRAVLTRRKDDVAQGVAAGLLCFLRDEKP